MLSSWLVALSVAVSPGQCATCGPVDGGMMGGGMAFSPGMTSGSWSAGMGGFGNPYDAVSMGGGGGGDQLYPFDSPEPWLWGHFQEIPAYGGYASFRPHNYKHVLAQMDVAGRWGISPTMAYSHQWYHRYRQRGGMHPNFGTPYAASGEPDFGDIASVDGSSPSDRDFGSSGDGDSLIQTAAMERGYSGTPIPGISVPSYQFASVPEGRSALGDEYQSRIAQMQQHLDKQNYEMQVLRQQLQNNSNAGQMAAAPAGQIQYPNAAAYPGQVYATPNMAAPNQFAQSGYQELPPPAAYQQQPAAFPQASVPAMLPQQVYEQSAYPQSVPGHQFAPAPSSGYFQPQQYQQPAASTFVPQQFVPQQAIPQYSQPISGQHVWVPQAGSVTPQSYNAGPSGQAYQAAPQVNGSLNGYVAPQQAGQFSQSTIPTQPVVQPLLVPMESAGPLAAQAYGYGAQQPAVTYPQVPTVPPGVGTTYGSGSFVR